MAPPLTAITDQTFAAVVLGARQPVLVDFWAPWCTPCNIVAPVLAELAEEFTDQLTIVSINTDENQQVARAYKVASIPSFLLFSAGELQRVWVGARPKASLRAELAAALE